MQLLKTSDHGIFKKCPTNRPIDPTNLRHIKASLMINNMLEFRPIMVNKNMEVIDGQHRLEAAKELGLEVFYQINESTHSEGDLRDEKGLSFRPG
jgi:hypothetical protein